MPSEVGTIMIYRLVVLLLDIRVVFIYVCRDVVEGGDIPKNVGSNPDGITVGNCVGPVAAQNFVSGFLDFGLNDKNNPNSLFQSNCEIYDRISK